MMKWLALLLALFGTLGAESRAEDVLNQRLERLLPLEEEAPSADLSLDIADTFFQLQQYPWALLYAERALKYRPMDGKAQDLRERSRRKLFLDEMQISEIRPLIPIRAALAGFFWFLFGAFVLASFFMWKKSVFVFWGAAGAAAISAAFLLAAVKFQYFSPLHAICMSPAVVYQGEGVDYPLVFDKPLAAGSELGVVEASESGEWLKIQTVDGTIGFIPAKVIRII